MYICQCDLRRATAAMLDRRAARSRWWERKARQGQQDKQARCARALASRACRSCARTLQVEVRVQVGVVKDPMVFSCRNHKTYMHTRTLAAGPPHHTALLLRSARPTHPHRHCVPAVGLDAGAAAAAGRPRTARQHDVGLGRHCPVRLRLTAAHARPRRAGTPGGTATG